MCDGLDSSAPSVARALVAELVTCGITDAVLCPGSRNAPLALALAAACERGDIRLHVRIDERSAAFFALGLARVQKRPVAVVMTSGTAVAHCLPAMIEAYHAHVPLLILSADRPSRYIGTQASQTIEQNGLFSTVTPTVTIVAGERPSTAAGILRRALRAHHQVHVNVAFDTPLLTDSMEVFTAAHPAAPSERSDSVPQAFREEWGSARVDITHNTLVIAGDGAKALPGLEDVPTIAEPSAQLVPAPFHPVHPLAAEFFLHHKEARPAQIIVQGHPTLHRSVLKLLRLPGTRIIAIAEGPHYTDPFYCASVVASRLDISGEPTPQWLELTHAADESAAHIVSSVLDDDAYGFTGLHVAAALADASAVGDTVVCGASNAIRDLSLVGFPIDGVQCYSPRGAAGIDGTVSQAFGVAVATQSRDPYAIHAPRTLALMGDVTFLHDVGGLLVCTQPEDTAGHSARVLNPRPENLTIVVANDDGCGIFEALEQGAPEFRAYFDEVFGTPHGVEIGALCAAYGVTHCVVSSLSALHDALAASEMRYPGVHVIEARTTRATRRALHDAINARVRSVYTTNATK